MFKVTLFRKLRFLLLTLALIGSWLGALGQPRVEANDNGTRAVPPRPAWQGIGCESGLSTILAYVGEVSGATYYRVYRTPNRQHIDQMVIGTINTPVCDADSCRYEFIDYTADPFPDYYEYAFSACNSEGCSDQQSGQLEECVIGNYPPPENFQASQNTYQDKVKITWDLLGSNPYYYKIFFHDYGDDWNELGTTYSGGQNYFMDYDAPQGQKRYYSVQACTIDDNCGYPTESFSGWRRLPAPSFVIATNGTRDGYVAISWELIPGAFTYKLYRGTVSGTFDPAWTITYLTINSYTDNSVAGTTHYWYVVEACFPQGCSNHSADDEGWAGAPPPAPGNVQASDSLQNNIYISWDEVSEATYYTVWRAATSGGTYEQNSDKIYSDLFWRDLYTDSDVNYWYKVKACNYVEDGRCSALSSADSGVRIGHIAPPSNLQASDGDHTDKVEITWNPVSGATIYNVWSNTENDITTATSTCVEVAPSTSCDHISATPGTLYYYWVRSYDGNFGEWSDPDTGYAAGNPSPPTNVEASDGTHIDKVTISWDAAVSAHYYKIYRHTSNDPTQADYLGIRSDTSFDDETAEKGKIYYYWVKSYDETVPSESDFSTADTGYRKGLPAPSTISASRGTYFAKIRLEWSSVKSVESYYIYRNTTSNAASAQKIATIPKGTTVYDDTTAEQDRLYYYWVSTANTNYGEGDISSEASGYWNGLAAPIKLRASDAAYTDKVRITWLAAENAQSYKVYRNTINDPNSAVEIGPSIYTTFDDNSIDQDVFYYYWVKSRHRDYADSPFSASDIGYSSAAPIIDTQTLFLPLIIR